nr:hypothetical protein Itr_chr08CG21370 [Ipomoea trifida]
MRADGDYFSIHGLVRRVRNRHAMWLETGSAYAPTASLTELLWRATHVGALVIVAPRPDQIGTDQPTQFHRHTQHRHEH